MVMTVFTTKRGQEIQWYPMAGEDEDEDDTAQGPNKEQSGGKTKSKSGSHWHSPCKPE